MANAWCINAYDCNGCLIQTLQNLDSACIGVGVQYTAPNPLDDKRLDYIKYTDKCWCVQCLSWENEILIYATDWVIKNLTLTNDDVNEAIKIQWNDIFWSNRAKTVVRYKTGSAPVSITDWTLAVEETTKNQYSSTPFSLSGVLDETTYYITAFAVDSNNTVISSQTASVTTDFWWKPSANTVARYEFKSDITNHYWSDADWYAYSWSVSYENNMMKYTWELRKNKPTFTWWYSWNFTILSWRKYEWITSTLWLWRESPSINSWMSIPWNAWTELCSAYIWWTWRVIPKSWISNWIHLFAMVRNWNTLYWYLDWEFVWSVSVSWSLYSNLTYGSTSSGQWWTVWETIAENKARDQQEIRDYMRKSKSRYGL